MRVINEQSTSYYRLYSSDSLLLFHSNLIFASERRVFAAYTVAQGSTYCSRSVYLDGRLSGYVLIFIECARDTDAGMSEHSELRFFEARYHSVSSRCIPLSELNRSITFIYDNFIYYYNVLPYRIVTSDIVLCDYTFVVVLCGRAIGVFGSWGCPSERRRDFFPLSLRWFIRELFLKRTASPYGFLIYYLLFL